MCVSCGTMERMITRHRNSFFFFLYQAVITVAMGLSGQQHLQYAHADPVYFRGQGTLPKWTLTIAENQVIFESDTAGYDLLSFPHQSPSKAENGQVKHYVLHAEPYEMEIRIYEMLCENEGSNERFPYSVDVLIKPGNGTCTKFSGCGLYLTDGNLRGKWQVVKIKNDSLSHFGHLDKIPFLQLEPSGNAFTGFTGCNDISGRLFSEHTLFRFTDLVRGKEVCDSNWVEPAFVKGLQFTTQFAVKDNILVLSNPTSETLTLKKIE